MTLPDLISRLGEGTHADIVEIHHGRKVDAPSGTALALGEAVAAALGTSMDKTVYGREGQVGARPKGEIGIHAVRGGDEPGVHTVYLFNGSERIEVTHRALSRDVFAAGALRAAAFVAGQSAGRYDIQDVVRAGA
jgi:4-hydroxy-tetrahydrodipicolinate reductase